MKRVQLTRSILAVAVIGALGAAPAFADDNSSHSGKQGSSMQ